MKISARDEYACSAVLELALNYDSEAPIRVQDILEQTVDSAIADAIQLWPDFGSLAADLMAIGAVFLEHFDTEPEIGSGVGEIPAPLL